jgi:NADH-quinone oxidoreductase subunit I
MGYLDGFRVTFRKLFEERLTRNYSKGKGGKAPKPARAHGRHVLNRYEDGMEKCIGCELCAGVCPARCIYVRGADNPPDEPVSPGERYGFVYEINYLRCIHCDLCVEACPTEAITESKLFEFSFTNRQDAIYTKAELVVGDDGRPRQLPWEDWTDLEQVEGYTSAWMRATSPSGAAEHEGRVAWAGELGYGVKPADQGQRTSAEKPSAIVDPENPGDPHTSPEATRAEAGLSPGAHTGAATEPQSGVSSSSTGDEPPPETDHGRSSNGAAADAPDGPSLPADNPGEDE